MLTHAGLVKTTLLDYPGRVAATVFTHGCPLRCPYCHNPELVHGPVPASFLPIADLVATIKRRSGLIEGVCITGGEPLIHPEMEALIRELKAAGLLVKVDTSGAVPRHLRRLLEHQLIDFVAMDLKTDPEHYARVGGKREPTLESLRLVQESGVEHEFRTTVVPGIVEEADVHAIAALLTELDPYVLAQFRPGATLDPAYAARDPYPDHRLVEWCKALRIKKRRCSVRGVAELVAKGLEPLTERI